MKAVGDKTAEAHGALGMIWSIATSPFVLLGFLLYGLGAVVWLFVLSNWDVSRAYPLVGLGFLLTLVIGVLVGEHVTMWRVAGVVLIAAGVILVGSN